METSVTLLDTPSIKSGQETSPLSRLLVNSFTEALHWLLLKMTVECEQRDARNERLKVHYPQLSYNTELVRELFSRTGFLSTLSILSRQRLDQDINMAGSFSSFQHLQYNDGQVTARHFWGEENYEVGHFLQDNESFLSPDMLTTLCSSSDDQIKSWFQNPLDNQGKTLFSKEVTEDLSNKRHFLMESQQTLTVKFQYLVSSLMNLMVKTSSHFVFCFDSSQDISFQLEVFQIKELNFVRRNGFSYRSDFANFLLRYCFLGKNLSNSSLL